MCKKTKRKYMCKIGKIREKRSGKNRQRKERIYCVVVVGQPFNLYFNFQLCSFVCVLFFFFSLSHCLCFLIKYFTHAHTRTHTCICAHTCARAHSLAAADALRSLTHTGPAESRVARARYDVSLAHTHTHSYTHTVTIIVVLLPYILHVSLSLFHFAILPFFFCPTFILFSFVVCFALLNRCHLVVQQHLHLAAPPLLAAAAAVAINEPANQNKKCFSVAKCR